MPVSQLLLEQREQVPLLLLFVSHSSYTFLLKPSWLEDHPLLKGKEPLKGRCPLKTMYFDRCEFSSQPASGLK